MAEYSVQSAIEKIDKEIKKATKSMREYTAAIESLDHSRTYLIVNRQKKAALIEKLQHQKEAYMRMGGSFKKADDKVGIADRKIDYLDEDIKKVERNLKGLDKKSKNVFIRISAKSKEHKLKRLKNKKCRIEKVHGKVTNARVVITLLRLKYQSMVEGKRIGSLMAREAHTEDITKELEQLDAIDSMDAGPIRKATTRIKTGAAIFSSYLKLGYVNARCNILRTKDMILHESSIIPDARRRPDSTSETRTR